MTEITTQPNCPACQKPTLVCDCPVETGYVHPKSIDQFAKIYRKEYEQELESCGRWIKWCNENEDPIGVNFHEGMRASHVFNNIKMCQIIRILKREYPNA